ncbi:hypothetical protein [Tropicibacter sp. S64]|uniref:hypothetical protein n=1 Tax=Tropicibacter sp. S64 TaxID=3415122 RepID=UPI003C7A2781
MTPFDTARAVFEACETGKGCEVRAACCAEDAICSCRTDAMDETRDPALATPADCACVAQGDGNRITHRTGIGNDVQALSGLGWV